jgi:hypothetical protein
VPFKDDFLTALGCLVFPRALLNSSRSYFADCFCGGLAMVDVDEEGFL